jgi:urease accessory protein
MIATDGIPVDPAGTLRGWGAPRDPGVRVTRRLGTSSALAAALTIGTADPALAHENQVIAYGSFLAGLTHPVLGLDHLLAMVSVGIVSVLIGGRAIWTVPGTFVAMMSVGAAVGWSGLDVPSILVESAIALSVILLGGVIVLDAKLPLPAAMASVGFFGFFHGYAHGAEIPDIAAPMEYAPGFLLGTVLLHLTGVLIGDIARRYKRGVTVLRIAGGVFVVIGFLFFLGVL